MLGFLHGGDQDPCNIRPWCRRKVGPGKSLHQPIFQVAPNNCHDLLAVSPVPLAVLPQFSAPNRLWSPSRTRSTVKAHVSVSASGTSHLLLVLIARCCHLSFAAAVVPNNDCLVTSDFDDGGEGNGTIALPIPSSNGGEESNEITTLNYPLNSPGV